MINRGWKKLCLKLKKRMICDQLQIIRFFCMHDESSSMMEITKKSLRADLADAAFGKSTAVYGRIGKNVCFVRKSG